MKQLEEIAYETGQHALADQRSLVADIRQRTGTLLAAHALVASFLGAATLGTGAPNVWGLIALCALALGLVVAAVLLAPWELRFSLDARELYGQLRQQAAREAEDGSLAWLVAVGASYEQLRDENTPMVLRMSRLCALLGVLVVVQTLAWFAGLIG